MTFSVSISSIEKEKVYDAVGEAVAKQVGFAEARRVADAVASAGYVGPGSHVSISVNGYGLKEGEKSGYLSMSLGFTTVEASEKVIVEPVQDSTEAS